jgi:hypothetical protein
MVWVGARTGNPEAQVYYTSPDLAAAVTRISKRYPGPYVDLGVGDGALYRLLPDPKQGVELRRLTPRLRGVEYGKDALQWTPSYRAGTVVMNPPFAKQVAFFNHAAKFANVIVWIAGLHIRLWTNEDMLDSSMHLVKEWVVPQEWSTFTTARGPVQVRTVVQVWKRQPQPRTLWQLRSTVKPCKDQLHPPHNASIVKRVGAMKDVGKVVPFHECEILSRYNTGHSDVLRTSHGTLHKAHGTSLALDEPLPTLDQRYRTRVIQDLLRHRASSASLCSLTIPLISAIVAPNWRRLIRPIEYLDGRRRHRRQW